MCCNETQDVSYLRFAAVLGPSIATGHLKVFFANNVRSPTQLANLNLNFKFLMETSFFFFLRATTTPVCGPLHFSRKRLAFVVYNTGEVLDKIKNPFKNLKPAFDH